MPKKFNMDNNGLPLPAAFHKMALIMRGKMQDRLLNEKWFPKSFRSPCIGLVHGIGSMGPISQKEIANWLGLDPSDVVSLIDILENEELVMRTRDLNDRRKQMLSLTRKGEELRKKLQIVGNEVMRDVLSPLDDKEVEIFRSMLQRVVQHHNENEGKK
jgi:DNA-binding MarR family transcriptional regulator